MREYEKTQWKQVKFEKDIAGEIERSPDTVNNWLKGKGDFPIGKAFKIQEIFFPTYTLEYLFGSEPITPGFKE